MNTLDLNNPGVVQPIQESTFFLDSVWFAMPFISLLVVGILLAAISIMLITGDDEWPKL